MRSQCNDFIVAIVVTVIVIVVVAVRRQQGCGLMGGRAGKMPGSGEFVAVREMVAAVKTGGQIEHQVMKSGMLEDLRVRQRWMATGPLLSTPERPVQIQHHVAEHVAHQQQS